MARTLDDRVAGREPDEALLAVDALNRRYVHCLDDGRFVPFEVNARFTGTMIGKAGIGFNLVLAALRHWTGGAAAGDPPLAPNRRVVQRLPMFMGYDADAEERLGASGSWTRDGED